MIAAFPFGTIGKNTHPRFLFFYDFDAGDDGLFLRRNGSVAICRFGVLADRIHDLHTGDHMAECGILAVKICAVLMHDKELGACGIV